MSNTPQVRFKGFTDAWEQRKLLEVANFIRGSFPQPYTNPNFYDENGGKPFVQVGDIGMDLLLNDDTKAHISSFAESKSRFVKAGTVIVALQGSIEKSIGRTAITQYDAFVDRTILIFESYKIPIDKLFFAQTIKSLFEIEKEKAWGATISTITKEYLCDFVIGVPNLDEQKKLGEFFKNLDSLITLQQRKCDALQKFKKSMFQKMFPQNGESVPEIRFAGFTDAWEQRKLGECFAERTERSADGELIAVTINSGVVKAAEINRHDNSSEDKSNYKVVKIDDIAYNSMRMWQGASGFSRYNGILSPAYTVLIPQEGVNSHFFAYMFKLYYMIHEFEINSQGLTKDTWNLKYPALSPISIYMPKYEEQTKIADYFENLDHFITLHQRKLETLQKMKKSLLQKMFPPAGRAGV